MILELKVKCKGKSAMVTSISKQGHSISKTTSGDNISKAITTEKKIQGTQFQKKKRTLNVQGSLVQMASGAKQAADVGGEAVRGWEVAAALRVLRPQPA